MSSPPSTNWRRTSHSTCPDTCCIRCSGVISVPEGAVSPAGISRTPCASPSDCSKG
jgi:hypothetical protein